MQRKGKERQRRTSSSWRCWLSFRTSFTQCSTALSCQVGRAQWVENPPPESAQTHSDPPQSARPPVVPPTAVTHGEAPGHWPESCRPAQIPEQPARKGSALDMRAVETQ